MAKMLMKVLKLDKQPLIDYMYRTPGRKDMYGRSRVIVAKFCYYQECAEVLQRSCGGGQLRFKGSTIFIAADYALGVAKARAILAEAKRLLRNRPRVQYGLLFARRDG